MGRAQREITHSQIEEKKLNRAQSKLLTEKSYLDQEVNNSDEELVLSDPVKLARKQVSEFLLSVKSTKRSSNLRKSSLKSSLAKHLQPSNAPSHKNTKVGLSFSSSNCLIPLS